MTTTALSSSPGPSPDPDEQARALAACRGAVAAVGDYDRAEQIARSITDPYTQALALAGMASSITEPGPPVLDCERPGRRAVDGPAGGTGPYRSGDPIRLHQ